MAENLDSQELATPSLCNHCGKRGDSLRRCSRCKMVAYCSTECQRQDWTKRHRSECKKTISPGSKTHTKESKLSPEKPRHIQATLREEWSLDSLQHGTTMCLHGEKQITCGVKVPDKVHCPIVVYNMKKRRKEATLCRVAKNRGLCGISSLSIGRQHFILLSLIANEGGHEYQLWSYPHMKCKPVYIFTVDCESSAHAVIDSTLLVVDGVEAIIHEIDASSIPFRPTGRIITTDLTVGNIIGKMYAFKSNGSTRLLLMYKDMTDWITAGKYNTDEDWHSIPQGELENSTLKCYDYSGHLLWKMLKYKLDGKAINTVAISADNEGHVFMSDRFHNRVILLGHNSDSIQSVKTLIITPGKVGNVEWQEETRQLVIMYENAEGTKTLSGRYDIREIPQTQTENLAENLRQKVSVIPQENKQVSNVCSYCGKAGERFGKCAKCRVARYCSSECQAEDWKEKHCDECKELRKSGKAERTSKNDGIDRPPKVILSGQPWSYQVRFLGSKMCLFKNKQIVSGLLQSDVSTSVMIYNITIGVKEAEVCSVRKSDKATGHSIITIDNTQYIVVTLSYERFELWSYPVLQSKPVYVFTTNFCSPCHTFFDGSLLVADGMAMTIREFDSSSIPFKPTGKVIPTDLVMGNMVKKMCVFFQNGEKNIVLMYNDLSDYMTPTAVLTDDQDAVVGYNLCGMVIKSFDVRGKQLWTLAKHRLDGVLISPNDVCTDDSGHVFVADRFNRRVVVLHCGQIIQSIRNLIDTPGNVGNIEWCSDTEHLLVMYDNVEQTKTMAACYDVSQVGEAKAQKSPKKTKSSSAPWGFRKSHEAIICGKPASLEADEIAPDRMCFDDEKLLMGGLNIFDGVYSPVFVFNRTSGTRERILCDMPDKEGVNGISLIKVVGVTYIAISICGKYEANKFQLWPWPGKASVPVYTFTVQKASSSHLFHEDKLLLYDRRERTIDEYDVSAIPFKSTGFQIRTDLVLGDFVLNMCITRGEKGEKKLIILYRQEVDETELRLARIKCFDYTGQLLWKFHEVMVDGSFVDPSCMTSDGAGHIFVADRKNKRVLVLNPGQTIQNLIKTPGKVRQGVKLSYKSYKILYFWNCPIKSYIFSKCPINPIFSTKTAIFVNSSKHFQGMGYVSQLYVRGMASLHLMYHPVHAE